VRFWVGEDAMQFRALAVVTAMFCWVLAAALCFAPGVLAGLFAVDFSYPVGLVMRRAGAIFVGLGLMFWLAREAGPSAARTGLSAGFAAACGLLAASGAYEYLTGHAGAGILAAAAVEVALAAALATTRV